MFIQLIIFYRLGHNTCNHFKLYEVEYILSSSCVYCLNQYSHTEGRLINVTKLNFSELQLECGQYKV